MADIIIKGGTVITMDPERRIIDKGAVAIKKDKIIAVGSARKILKDQKAHKVIDARGKVIILASSTPMGIPAPPWPRTSQTMFPVTPTAS